MNQLTYDLVIKVARERLNDARVNGTSFAYYVQLEHDNFLIAEFAPELQEFMFELLAVKIPFAFERDNGRLFIKDYEPWFYDLELMASNVLVDILRLSASCSQKYKLHPWGNLPEKVANPNKGDALVYWPEETQRILNWVQKHDREKVEKLAHKYLKSTPVDQLIQAGYQITAEGIKQLELPIFQNKTNMLQ